MGKEGKSLGYLLEATMEEYDKATAERKMSWFLGDGSVA